MNLLIAERDSSVVPMATGHDWLDQPLNGGLRPGGCYLISGAPGSNKSTLAVQASVALAALGVHVLFVLTEQKPSELLGILRRVMGGRFDSLAPGIMPYLGCEVLDRAADLSRLLHRVIPMRFSKTKVIILDSLQGMGLASTATRSYRTVFAFLDEAKARGFTTFNVAHITKTGQIAGPKSLEHKVDVAVVLRKTYKFRHLFVLKNRYGPEVVDPIVLTIESGCLEPCSHAAGHCASALGFAGAGDELLEVQVAVGIPRLGAKAELTAPYLPGKRLKQLVRTVSNLRDVDLHELSYAINALIPNSQSYRPEMDLPIAVALLSAYLHQPVPPRALFVGQIDLRLNIRSPDPPYIAALANAINDDMLMGIDRLYLSSSASGFLAELVSPPQAQGRLQIVGLRTFVELVELMWPGAIKTGAEVS